MCNAQTDAWHIFYVTVYELVTILIETYLISTIYHQPLICLPSIGYEIAVTIAIIFFKF